MDGAEIQVISNELRACKQMMRDECERWANEINSACPTDAPVSLDDILKKFFNTFMKEGDGTKTQGENMRDVFASIGVLELRLELEAEEAGE